MQALARLPSGKHLLTIDPQAQHLTIAGPRDPLVLSFEDAHRALDVLSCHRVLFSQVLDAHLDSLPDWVHQEIIADLMEQIRRDEAMPEEEQEPRAAHHDREGRDVDGPSMNVALAPPHKAKRLACLSKLIRHTVQRVQLLQKTTNRRLRWYISASITLQVWMKLSSRMCWQGACLSLACWPQACLFMPRAPFKSVPTVDKSSLAPLS
jgi:hypothetical protein